MILWIDCEWNGYKGDLISMALVDEHGAEWYEVLERHDTAVHPWVLENVIPKLGQPAVSLLSMRMSLEVFIRKYPSIHIVADWPEDIARFCELLILGPGLRMNTPPLTMEVVRLDAYSENPHNALSDARALRLAHFGMKT